MITPLVIHILLGVIALAGLLLGAELVIRGAKNIALRLGLSEFFVGLTLLSILTSLPEITEHVVASIDILKGIGPPATLAGVAIGTNVGSNIIQITLITGVVGLFGLLICNKRFLKIDYVFMLFAIMLLWGFAYTGMYISRVEGVTLFLLYMGYLFYQNRHEKIIEKFSLRSKKKGLLKECLLVAVGFVMLVYGANHILKQAVFFSETYNVSGSLIGTLIVGVATALPELTTSLTAVIKKSAGLSLGTLVGSNITNPLMALGLGAAISGYPIGNALVWFDIPFWFGISLLGFFLFWKGKYLSKPQAITLIIGYLVYLSLRLRLFL
ncbi:hypothetical protein DRJ48_02360 [Candidatus Woesearchaeota archaeon]|nr:MAG: hypothetical protein DRJ48_02360 [Candidatus Woesearchaeota archaeon]